MSPRPKRTEQHPNLEKAIKDTAWEQIARTGAASLSLRAIARELGITAPAIYNYFPDRDALVTALIIDAYTSFGDWQIKARESVPRDAHVARLKAIGLAYREWAHTYPQRYQLIFGTLIPGYQAPMEQVLPSSARSISALFSVVEDIRVAGILRADSFPEVQGDFQAYYEVWKQNFADVHPLSMYVAMIIWARVHGIVSLEIQGNLPPFGPKGDDLYRFELEALKQQFIKTE